MLELGADDVADGDQMRIGAIAFGTCFSRLDAAVNGLGKAVVQAGAKVFEDAIQ